MRIRGIFVAPVCALMLLMSCPASAQKSTGSTSKKQSAPAGRTLGQPKESSEQAQKVDEKPSMKPVLENQKVQVFRYELPAGASLKTAEHQTDRIVVPTGDLTMLNGRQRIVARTGEVQIAKRGPGEQLINNGKDGIVVVVIDLLQPFDPDAVLCGLGGAHCESLLGGDLKAGSWGINTLLKSMTLEIANMEMDPGVTTDEMKRRAPFLRVAITQLKVAEQVGEGTPSIIEQVPGDVTWVPVGDPVTLKNMGVTKASFAMITFP